MASKRKAILTYMPPGRASFLKNCSTCSSGRRGRSTVGDAETYFRNLNAEQHQKSHWDTAVRMFAIAMREPAYLRGATLSLENALALDRLIVRIQNGYLQA